LHGRIYAISFPSEYNVRIIFNNVEENLRYFADFVERKGRWTTYILSEQKLKMLMSINCEVVVERYKSLYRYRCSDFADVVVKLNE